MAGDWIKMRVNLSTHPKVLAMASFLHGHGRYVDWQAPASSIGGVCMGDDDHADHDALVYAALRVTRYVTVAALLRFWGYANEHADAEFIRGLCLNDIDEITGVPGFGEAMAHAGWASTDPSGGVRLPNFSKFNSVAKVRSSAADRQRRYRERHGNGNGDAKVTRDVTVTSQPREEKRREEERREEKEEKSARKRAAPQDFVISESTREWARANGHDHPDASLAYLLNYAAANGRKYANWDRALRNAIEGDWGDARRKAREAAARKIAAPSCCQCQRPSIGKSGDGASYCTEHMPAQDERVTRLLRGIATARAA